MKRPSASRHHRMLLPLIALLSCSGCATGAGSDGGVNPCRLLPLPSYSRAFNAALADELSAAPAAARWPLAIRDYAALRDAVRACRNAH